MLVIPDVRKLPGLNIPEEIASLVKLLDLQTIHAVDILVVSRKSVQISPRPHAVCIDLHSSVDTMKQQLEHLIRLDCDE